MNEDAGTTGFNTLKISYSARANAMGLAQTGMAINPDAMQFNPAALLNLPQKAFSTTYMNYFLDANGGNVQVLLPRDKYQAYGFYLNYLNMGSMDRTEISSTNELKETGETFGAQNIILGFSTARWMNQYIDLGATAKIIYDQIDNESASALLLDAGMIHHPANEKIKVGLSIRNLGKQISYYTSENYHEKLPLVLAAGIAYTFNPKLLVTVELNKASGQDFSGRIGSEYKLDDSFDLRAGYKTNAEDWRTGGSWEWTSGISLGAGWSWNKFQVDYSLSSYGDLGFVNQVSIARMF
ncbi:MAG: PorV/PorQ family protein [Proteiniphilum sp.]|nr:PorV/PorQ family protein [Proteiniphilum sp.]